MKHTSVEPVRRWDRSCHGAPHACAHSAIDLLFDRNDFRFVHAEPRDPLALDQQRVATNPVTLDFSPVPIAPAPVVTDADMLEISAALYLEESRPAFPMGLLSSGARQRVDALDVAAVVFVGVAAEQSRCL